MSKVLNIMVIRFLSIVGVRSFCKKDSKKIYQGKDLVSVWLFVALDSNERSKILSVR